VSGAEGTFVRRLLLFLAVVALGFAPAPFPRPERRQARPANELIGTWARDRQGHVPLTITHERMSWANGYDYELRLDVRSLPASFHIRGVGRPNNGWEFFGIYKVEGDTLTLNYDHANGKKPTAFEGPGKGPITEVYKRARR
jgi:uncharacterized protein (TIGR03067 family)